MFEAAAGLEEASQKVDVLQADLDGKSAILKVTIIYMDTVVLVLNQLSLSVGTHAILG